MVLQQSLLGELVKNVRELQCVSHCFYQEAKSEKPSWLHLLLSCCYLPLQKGEGGKSGKKGIWTSKRGIFHWNKTDILCFTKEKEEDQFYPKLWAGNSCWTEAGIQQWPQLSKCSFKTVSKDLDLKITTLLVKERAQDLSVALKPNDRAELSSS